ncbi:MAG: hypothetical protein AAF573_22565, partial [Bacteroidota bacterium]
ECIDKDLYSVKEGRKRSVIDKNLNTIIPAEINFFYFVFRKINSYSNDILIKRNGKFRTYYTVDGEKITSWSSASEGDVFHFQTGLNYLDVVIGQTTVKELSKEKRNLLNPYNAWITKRSENGKWYQRLENTEGKPLTEKFTIVNYSGYKGVFVIKTKSGKFGAIEVQVTN